MTSSEGLRDNLLSYLRRAFAVLEPRARPRVVASVVVIAALSLLDLFALFLVLAITSLAVRAQSNDAPATRVPGPPWMHDVLGALHLDTVTGAVALLAGLAVITFVGKAVLATYALRRILRFLARQEVNLTVELMSSLMAAPLSFHLKRRYLETMTDMTVGAECLVMKGIAPAVLICSEGVLVITITTGLLFLAPVVALAAAVYFTLVLGVLNRVIGRRAALAGERDVTATRNGMIIIQWALGGFREVVTRGAESFFGQRLHEVRGLGAESRADTAFLSLLPRYFLEASLILGMALVFMVQLPFGGPSRALTGLTLFAVAGFRLLPSVQRLQGSTATIKGSHAYGERCLLLREQLAHVVVEQRPAGEPQDTLKIRSEVRFDNVSFRYDDAPSLALDRVSVTFQVGRTTALVGPSGSGKTTAVDVLLGLLAPSSGRVLIDGQPLYECARQWRSSVGYVPQAIFLMPCSIRENVALGVAAGDIDDDVVWNALRKASVDDVVHALPGGLGHVLGDSGAGLSGGQRQRLGIARALYAAPSVLVLDEATSALDVETEAEITETLAGLGPELTKVVVAHRLSTVRDADQVLFLSHGRVAAQGTFSEVASAVPDFARQVALSGLTGVLQTSVPSSHEVGM